MEEFVHNDDKSNKEFARVVLEDVKRLFNLMKINEGLDENNDVNLQE